MKSAYERALERMGADIQHYSTEEKEELAEVDRIYDAKEAEARLSADQRLKEAASDPQAQEQIRTDLATELASIERQREQQKAQLRESFGKEESGS